MLCLDIVTIIVSNPLYILSYFSESHFLRLLDAMGTLGLGYFTLFTAFAMLLIAGVLNEEVGIGRFLMIGCPFFLFVIVAAGGLIYHHVIVEHDILGGKTVVSLFFTVMKVLGLSLFCFAYLTATKFVRDDMTQEGRTHIILGALFFVSYCGVELQSALSGFVQAKFLYQIYSFLASGIFVMFFNWLNWPMPGTRREDNEQDKGESLAEDLVE
jgi:hypothetical protein